MRDFYVFTDTDKRAAMHGETINLLFITSYANLGGGETILIDIIEHLALRDPRYRMHLIVPQEGQMAERFRRHGWQVAVEHWRGVSVYFVPALWGRFPIVDRLAALMKAWQIDVVHTEYHSLAFAQAAAQRAGIGVAWTCWGWWFHPRRWQRDFFRKVDVTFIATTQIEQGFLGDPPFVPRDRITRLPIGVDSDRFRPGLDGSSVRADAGLDADAPLVVMIARFQDVKGHDVFQAMARRVARVLPAVRFVVAGENIDMGAVGDAYKAAILETARTDPLLRDRLVYLGFRSDPECVIAAADVVVCASKFETYGMVNIEAMASQTPVVSTNAGGPAESVVDGVTGFLVNVGDDATMAERVLQLLSDPDLRARMGAAGRMRVLARYAIPVMVDTFEQALLPLIERRVLR